MKLGNLIEGIETLRRYYDDPMGWHVGADHGVVYLFKTDHPMSADDVARMWSFGWTQEQSPENYDPSKSWAAYV